MKYWGRSFNSNWNEISDKPSILNDGLISWSEIQNRPIIERGVFTPKLTDSANFNYTHTAQEGFYVKIDNVLFLNVKVVVLNAYRNGFAHFQITDFPFVFDTEKQLEGYFYNVTINCNPFFLTMPSTNKIKIMYATSTSSVAPAMLLTTHPRSGTGHIFVAYMSGMALIQ
ncbi:MAG: hypothetical protein ACRC2M_03110 [Planktothrix sp.]